MQLFQEIAHHIFVIFEKANYSIITFSEFTYWENSGFCYLIWMGVIYTIYTICTIYSIFLGVLKFVGIKFRGWHTQKPINISWVLNFAVSQQNLCFALKCDTDDSIESRFLIHWNRILYLFPHLNLLQLICQLIFLAN